MLPGAYRRCNLSGCDAQLIHQRACLCGQVKAAEVSYPFIRACASGTFLLLASEEACLLGYRFSSIWLLGRSSGRGRVAGPTGQAGRLARAR